MVRKLTATLGVSLALVVTGAVVDHGSVAAAPHNSKSQTCSQQGGGGKNSPHTVTCVGVISLGGILSNDTITINNNTLLSKNELNILANDLNSKNFLSISDIQTEVVNIYKSDFNILNISTSDVTVVTCLLGLVC
jgi:hypothetical protein